MCKCWCDTDDYGVTDQISWLISVKSAAKWCNASNSAKREGWLTNHCLRALDNFLMVCSSLSTNDKSAFINQHAAIPSGGKLRVYLHLADPQTCSMIAPFNICGITRVVGVITAH